MKKQILILLMLLFANICFAQYPFEKYPAIKYIKIPVIATQSKVDKTYIGTAKYKKYKLVVLEKGLTDKSNLLLYFNNKLSAKIVAPLDVSEMMMDLILSILPILMEMAY